MSYYVVRVINVLKHCRSGLLVIRPQPTCMCTWTHVGLWAALNSTEANTCSSDICCLIWVFIDLRLLEGKGFMYSLVLYRYLLSWTLLSFLFLLDFLRFPVSIESMACVLWCFYALNLLCSWSLESFLWIWREISLSVTCVWLSNRLNLNKSTCAVAVCLMGNWERG